jgi:hypothetical protein
VRVLAVLAMLPLVGCSMLLGIEDPSPGSGPPTDRLVFSAADFKISQLQAVRLHVLRVQLDGTMDDVTPDATYSSDNDMIAAIGGPGVILGGSQAGTATIKASLGTSIPAMVKATVTANPCHPVINEVVTGGASGGADEWVEVYNPCTNAVDVTNWTLVYRAAGTVSGVPDSNLMIALMGQMAPGDLRLYAGTSYTGISDGTWLGTSGIMQQMSGAVALRDGPKDMGALVDSIAYGTVADANPFIETKATMMMSNGLSASRMPFDGNDTNDNSADFMIISTPTPRAPNVP